MPLIRTAININAPPAHVHKVFLDALASGSLSLFITSFSASLALLEPGTQLKVVINPDGKPMEMTPKVISNTAEQFLWLGVLGATWIFSGHHQFRFLEGATAEETRFEHEEDFSGLLAGLLLFFIRGSTTRGFETVNQALKEKVELAGL